MSRALLPILLLIASAASADDHPGLAVYRKSSCHLCHAADGSGNTPAGKSMKTMDLRAPATQTKKDEELAKTIAEGRGKMPAFKTLTAEQIAQLVGYIRTLAQK